MTNSRIRLVFFTLLFYISSAHSQGSKLDQMADRYARKHFSTFYELLSLPCDAHFPNDIMKNIDWAESEFQKRNFKVAKLSTPTVPLLLAERSGKENASKTVLIYLQFDGQPVVPSQWDQESPWTPVLKRKNAADGSWQQIPYDTLSKTYDRDWRIYARGAADAKGPDVMFLAALDAIDEAGIVPDFNMKVIMDFEEELGSPNLPDAVDRYKKELKADMFIIFDGPPHISNKPTLAYGVRGISDITLTTFGPKVPLHSGHYGNYAPNPALHMAKLLASMKDDNGRVVIKGFYDGIKLSDSYKKALQNVPEDEKAMQKKLGFKKPEGVAANYQEALQYPSLNIRGLQAAEVGDGARTVIPDKAIAEIDMRLVLESDPKKLIGLIKKHIAGQGFHLIEFRDPTDIERQTFDKICRFDASVSYGSFRTDLASPVGTWLRKAMAKAYEEKPIQVPLHGGSIPISPFVVKLGIDAVIVPTVNPDNNQHSPNENLRIGNFVDGIKTMIAILSESF